MGCVKAVVRRVIVAGDKMQCFFAHVVNGTFLNRKESEQG